MCAYVHVPLQWYRDCIKGGNFKVSDEQFLELISYHIIPTPIYCVKTKDVEKKAKCHNSVALDITMSFTNMYSTHTKGHDRYYTVLLDDVKSP